MTSLLLASICAAHHPHASTHPASEGFHCEYEAVHISSVYLYRGGCVAKRIRGEADGITSNPFSVIMLAQSEETQGSIPWSGIALEGAGAQRVF